ncbi:MAG TPA: glycosyltransferase family 39 protein [Bryobacterales bacterium]|nr:glycosyltransferase family 39 protein [Bryobacterales bacterium]
MHLRRFLLLALLAAFVARIVATYHVFNETMDEPAHIRAGLEFLRTRQYNWEPQHPPLARMTLAVLPYCFARFHLYRHLRLWMAVFRIREEPANYWVGLAVSRAGNLLFGTLILLFVWRWSRVLFGPWPAVAACAVASCSPNLIAHTALATLDAAAAAGTVVAAFFLWRWSEHAGWRYALGAGAAFGFAVLCKFSTAAFLPPLAVIYFATARWNRWRTWSAAQARTGLLRGAAFVVVAGTVVWAGYGFDAGPLVPPGHHYYSPFPMGDPTSAASRLTPLLGHHTLPAPRF